MTVLVALALILLVPAQVTVAAHLRAIGAPLDLCLVAACLVGFFFGPWWGGLAGVGVGMAQDLFSAGPIWLAIVSRAGAGALAGLAAKQLVEAANLSILAAFACIMGLSGLLYLTAARGGRGVEMLATGSLTSYLPEVCLNATVAFIAHGLLSGRFRRRDVGRWPLGLLR